jgi:shikimate kinase/3-dehydroquinate synthase
MATGKSTVGPLLAARLGVPFVDTDDLVAREAGRSVPDVWREEGEAAFRARELAIVRTLLASSAPAVVSFGGGTVTLREARHLALEQAFVVTLTSAPESILARVSDLAGRPNLAVGDPLARARALLAEREEAYSECHLALATDTMPPEQAVDRIVEAADEDPLVMPLGGRSYRVDVGAGIAPRLGRALAEANPSSLVFVTDENVARDRGAAFDEALSALRIPIVRVTLAPGEANKTAASVGRIWDAALTAGIDRNAVVVAAGGGVVGDLAGFAAATLLRGVRFVQAPTTLLAMVDSSVGGKTGFDHPTGKNLIGAFHQPSRVVIDLAHLETLPARERTAGLAEVVKIALTNDAALLEHLEANCAAVAAGEAASLLPVVRAAVARKIAVVRDDERETGARALLNLGHTLGHALEAHGGYARHLHGEAVAIGTVLELEVAERLGFTPAGLAARAKALLEGLGLPTSVPRDELEASLPFVGSDKKRSGATLKFPVVTGPGVARVVPVPLDALAKAALAE